MLPINSLRENMRKREELPDARVNEDKLAVAAFVVSVGRES